MRVAIAADHGGLSLKTALVERLQKDATLEVEDFGVHDEGSVDYPDFAHRVAEEVVAGRFDRGILVCGTGVGMAIAANRHRGIRCVNCSDVYTAKLSREHNDANVLSLGARVVGVGLAWELVTAWLAAAADPDPRHLRRREKIERA